MTATLKALRMKTKQSDRVGRSTLKAKAATYCSDAMGITQCINLLVADGVLVDDQDMLTLDWDRLDERIEIYNQTP
jgi:hypothetical protein